MASSESVADGAAGRAQARSRSLGQVGAQQPVGRAAGETGLLAQRQQAADIEVDERGDATGPGAEPNSKPGSDARGWLRAAIAATPCRLVEMTTSPRKTA